MRYFKICDEGFHKDWGGDPTYWLEVNDHGHAGREIVKYPNGNVVSYDETHLEDEHGALSVMVVDGDENFWVSYEISKIDFEDEWQVHKPINRNLIEFWNESTRKWIVGQTFSTTRFFWQSEFDSFAQLSRDDNPIHVNLRFAAKTRFGRTVAHGMFLYSIVCGMLNRYFPRTVQLEQQLMFPAPTFAEEAMEIRISVKEASEQQMVVITQILNEAGELTCDGACVLAYG